MIFNYFKLALRSLVRRSFHSVINITGLSLALLIFTLSYIFVKNELTYDDFHENKDRIYRITSSELVNGAYRHRAGSAYSSASTLKTNYPQVQEAAKLFHHADYRGLPLLKSGERKLLIERLSYADPGFFNIFSFKFLSGDASSCLEDSRSVVLTRSMALRTFGKADVVGMEIVLSLDRDDDPLDLTEDYTMQVSAVIEDHPQNTHFDFEVLATAQFSPNERYSKNNWYYMAFPVYLLLEEGTDPKDFESDLKTFVQDHFDPKIKDRSSLHLQHLEDIRLGGLPGETKNNNARQTVWVISLISFVILLLACINYMNLSWVQYTRRAKEIGVRKVIGAGRKDLAIQFICESILISTLAMLLGVLGAAAVNPLFNQLMGTNLQINLLDPPLTAALIVTGLMTGLIPVIYPALFASGSGVVSALKGKTLGQRSSALYKASVVIQFSITTTLLIGMIVGYFQLDFILRKDLDIAADQYLFLRSKEHVYSNYSTYEAFKNTLKSHPNISDVAGTWSLPFGVNAPVFFYPFHAEGADINNKLHMHLFRADHDFIKTFNIQIIDGRDFSKSFATDPTSSFLLNEAAVKALGWQQDVLGKQLEVYSGGGSAFKKGKVIGIVKDLNFRSLHQEVSPMVISMTNNQRYRYIVLKINKQDVKSTLEHIETTWASFVPGWPLELFSLEQEWMLNYQKEQKLSSIIQCLTLSGILIACLGLFALSSYMTQQRQKEIGIRKVIGASIPSILKLINKEFIFLIILAMFMAIPIGWYFGEQWLEQFAYRIKMSPLIFLGAMCMTCLISVLTVSYHSLKAATENPVNVLKNE